MLSAYPSRPPTQRPPHVIRRRPGRVRSPKTSPLGRAGAAPDRPDPAGRRRRGRPAPGERRRVRPGPGRSRRARTGPASRRAAPGRARPQARRRRLASTRPTHSAATPLAMINPPWVPAMPPPPVAGPWAVDADGDGLALASGVDCAWALGAVTTQRVVVAVAPPWQV